MLPLSMSSNLSFSYGHPVAAYVFFLVFPFFCPSVSIATDMTFFCKNEDMNMKQFSDICGIIRGTMETKYINRKSL
jgi:hypothetical protein